MTDASVSRKRALLSVYDKRGIVDFAAGLVRLGFELVSTGGTLNALREADLPVTPVDEITGVPEMLGGRVKTLHPRVHGGILARRHMAEDMAEIQAHHIPLYDVVAVNLYPFREVASRPGVSWDDLLEHIDIGGPAMVRAAAKNFPHVVVVVNPDRYPFVISGLERDRLAWDERKVLAQEAFAHTAEYDQFIAKVLDRGTEAVGDRWDEAQAGATEAGDRSRGTLPPPRHHHDQSAPAMPERLTLHLRRRGELRYGENPHQAAAFYVEEGGETGGGLFSRAGATIAGARQLQGRALSYNNINDAATALELVTHFREPAAVAVKHANPCGVAVAPTLSEAFERARDADPISIFGGIVALNRPVDEATARRLGDLFLEVIVAPGFDQDARRVLAEKKSLRLLEVDGIGRTVPYWEVRGVRGGLLIQEADVLQVPLRSAGVVTERAPADEEWHDLDFAWRVCRYVKSNGIVVAKGGRTLGIGAGQMNRVQAARLALEQAGDEARGAVLASEAFFPFPDVVEAAAAAGIRAIAQPGGAKRDQESIAACNAADIAMVFTHIRHFRH